MVSPRKDEISDKTFIAIDDKVTTKFLRFFMFGYQSSRRQTFKVASDGLKSVIRDVSKSRGRSDGIPEP